MPNDGRRAETELAASLFWRTCRMAVPSSFEELYALRIAALAELEIVALSPLPGAIYARAET
jgi:hypothetical protein